MVTIPVSGRELVMRVAIELWAEHWNDVPKLFIWHRSAGEIVERVRRGRSALANERAKMRTRDHRVDSWSAVLQEHIEDHPMAHLPRPGIEVWSDLSYPTRDSSTWIHE